ncbi:JAB domain-containing protein [Daejeonella lutea]|uniref:DNA repair protein RadC n=1 Tax=Daejeonella lutea TaxID=572036 RepID=A0A1T5CX74_9SPHI|nr:JAB domain-containing protein [Daejeonella lutea]SKB63936.1 DNA repair protein RadC [Daejeonella lutea]
METKNMKVAEVQISYKTTIKSSERPQINTSIDAYRVLQENWNYEIIEFIEEFKIILLNRANRVLAIAPISTGGTAGTIADPKVIFVSALKCNAASIFLVHNHPSGNLKPSHADIELTKKLKNAGHFLDLPVIEHIIFTKDSYLSFADEGMM